MATRRYRDSTRGWRSARLVAAVVCPVLATVALVPLRDSVSSANLALALVGVVLTIAILGGRPAAIVASLSAALAFDVLLTRPFNSFRIATSADIQTAVLLAVIGLIAGELVERARRSAESDVASRLALDSLRQHAELAAGTDSPGRLIGLVSDELTSLLALESCAYANGPLPTEMRELTHRSIVVPSNLDPSVAGLVALPVRAHGRLQGNLVLAMSKSSSDAWLSADQRHAAVALADQLGIGLLRFRDSGAW
jgi:K+-sensing histidine kinase KdpD